jgi:L-threonylcarbamoyladenylate synthase
VSPTSAADVRTDLGNDVDLILDGGPCRVGVESTIVDCTGTAPTILRLGGVAQAAIEAVVGASVELRTAGTTAAPGTLPGHYAPTARVMLVERQAVGARAAGLLAAGWRVGLLAAVPALADLPGGLTVLDPPADIDDFARVLYARLRDADRAGLEVLLAVAPPPDGVGAAVADRLARAAVGTGSTATGAP